MCWERTAPGAFHLDTCSTLMDRNEWSWISRYCSLHILRRESPKASCSLSSPLNSTLSILSSLKLPSPSQNSMYPDSSFPKSIELWSKSRLRWPGSLLQKHWFVPVGKPLLSRFPNRERQSGTKGGGNRCCALLSRVWQPGQKRTYQPGQRCSQRPRGWRTLLSRLVLPTGTQGLFFLCFSFLNSFSISIILLHFN